MTPHGILTDMGRVEARLGPRMSEMFEPGLWASARSVLEVCIAFEFGAASPRAEHVEFANECLAKEVFRLPFDVVCYTGSVIPKTAVVAVQYVDNDVLEELCWFVAAPCIDRASGETFYVPIQCGNLVGTDPASGRPTSLECGTVNWKSMTTTGHASRKTGELWGVEQFEAASEKALRMILGATALMMSRDVDVRTDKPSERLNRQRIAKGKRPIGETRFIYIRPEKQHLYRDASREFADSRAGPAMHWRRGHFRTIHRDTERQRTVPVAPTLVGANELAPHVLPQPKTYKMSLPTDGEAG